MTSTPASRPTRCRPPPVTPPTARPQPSPRTTSPTSGLADEGVRRIEWAEREMPVLRLIRERFERERPLEGLRIGACLHVTTETANLMRTLTGRRRGGRACARPTRCPPRTTWPRRSSPRYGISTFARRGEDRDTYYAHLNAVADTHPQLTMDDGCDLVSLLHKERPGQLSEVWAGTEETTTGVIRLRAMAADGALRFPVVAVNEAKTKHLFDNRYGTGQSTVDGILRATNILLAGRRVVVAGLRLGRARHRVAASAGMGSQVTIVEVDPVARHRGAHGRLRGHERRRRGPLGRGVHHRHRQPQRLPARAFRGHAATARSWPTAATSMPSWSSRRCATLAGGRVREVRRNVQEYDLGDRKLYVVAEGRLVNLGAAEGHPAVGDGHVASRARRCRPSTWPSTTPSSRRRSTPCPTELDREIARLKLEALGVHDRPDDPRAGEVRHLLAGGDLSGPKPGRTPTSRSGMTRSFMR